MRKSMALAAILPAVMLVFAATTPARAQSAAASAQPTCQQRLIEAKAEWKASPIPTSAARATGWGNNGAGKSRDHPGMVTNYMERQLQSAERLCKEGKDHDSLLRIDLVRAYLKLPFEEHPASHGYHPGTGAAK